MFKKMEYILAVYEEQSFTCAAEKLFISQPCLSAAVRKTEEEIGMPLFERRYSSLRPTEIGFEYIKTAQRIMDLEKDFHAKISDINSLDYGSIAVGGSNYVSSYIIPRIVGVFSKLYPKINISLTETSSVELEKKTAAEEIDLFIDSFDEELEQFECHPLLCEKILLAVPKGNICNEGIRKYGVTPREIFESGYETKAVFQIPLDHFKNEKFILLKSGNNMHRHAKSIFKDSGFTPDVLFMLDQLITSYNLCASGAGMCFVTDTLFKYHKFDDDVLLYNVNGSGTRTLYIGKKRNRYTSKAMEMFIETAKLSIRENAEFQK